MTATAGGLLRAGAWAALALGALSLARLPGDYEGVFCGAWG
jgi:hypothetical protein